MFFTRGQILEINTISGTDFATVIIAGDVIVGGVLIVYPYNTTSKPLIESSDIDTNQILLFKGVNGQIYGEPYNIPLQNPNLLPGEYEIGNQKKGNKIIFKANGDIKIVTPTGTAINIIEGGDIEITGGGDVKLGDASSAVLNLLATMQVTVTGGSSAGTYPVSIITSGQTADKVKA